MSGVADLLARNRRWAEEIERMLAHSSGVIGLPLRLLAREVYNKIAARAGADSVAAPLTQGASSVTGS